MPNWSSFPVLDTFTQASHLLEFSSHSAVENKFFEQCITTSIYSDIRTSFVKTLKVSSQVYQTLAKQLHLNPSKTLVMCDQLYEDLKASSIIQNRISSCGTVTLEINPETGLCYNIVARHYFKITFTPRCILCYSSSTDARK